MRGPKQVVLPFAQTLPGEAMSRTHGLGDRMEESVANGSITCLVPLIMLPLPRNWAVFSEFGTCLCFK